MEILENSYTTLRAIGKDEVWLQRWIAEKPSRLGLGNLVIKNSELIHYKNKGGRLDLLAYRGDLDTYYEIEIMLGECDADHGFRTLDYWARERLKAPNARHVAVLIAEDLSGRYKTIIETLPQFLPFIGIEIKVLRLEGPAEICTIDTAIIAQPDDLVLQSGDEPDEPVTEGGQPKDRTWWEGNSNATFLGAVDAIAKYCTEDVGASRLDYSAQSYISLKKGRRCWLPMWPRANGVYVYLPGGQNGAADAPSDFYNSVKQRLEDVGMESPSWTYKYNGGANPIAFPIPLDRAAHSVVREIISEAYALA
ncbi:MAG TPA: hypothetical protein VI756_22845 [Blastocatellia bacterium]